MTKIKRSQNKILIFAITFLLLAIYFLYFSGEKEEEIIRNTKDDDIIDANVTEKYNFIFHANHKTGTTITRHQLQKFCDLHDLRCLSWEQACDGEGAYSRCNGHNSFTPKGVTRCCNIAKDESPAFHGLIDHFIFPTKLPQRAFLQQHFAADAVEFTILREPIQQLLSYVHFRCDKYVSKLDWQCQATDDELLMGYMNNEKAETISFRKKNTLHRPVFFITGNSDPDGIDNYQQAEEFLNNLDFVGIYEDLGRTWCILRHILNWPDDFFPQGNVTISKTRIVDANTVRQFKEYYSNDYNLYNHAKTLYSGFVHQYKHLC